MIHAKVSSASIDGTCYNVYIVTRDKDLIVQCECKGFKFTKTMPRKCRHTESALAAIRTGIVELTPGINH